MGLKCSAVRLVWSAGVFKRSQARSHPSRRSATRQPAGARRSSLKAQVFGRPQAVDADLHVRSMATPQEAAKQAEQQQQIVEEDEFEEFEAEDWDARQEDPKNQALWEQDWDDDNINDDFSQRLKAELVKQQQQQHGQGA